MLVTFPVERYALTPMLSLAHRLGRAFSPADSFYIALARVLGASLLTCDAPLGRTAQELARVETVIIER